jgi:LEA14-like dessication related protein
MKPDWKNRRPYLLAVFATFFFISCSALRPIPLEVNLTGLHLESLTLSQADLTVRLRLFNPNRIAVTLQRLDYILLLEGVEVSDGRSAMPARIGAQQYGDLEISLSAPYHSLWRVVGGLATAGEVNFSLAGSVQVGGLGIVKKTFPIQRQGTVSLKNLARR